MKYLIHICLSVVVFIGFATNTFAHSHLADSMPKDGAVHTEVLKEVSINFDGKIMQGSNMQLKNENGLEATISAIEIGDGILIGKLAEPLANGTYTVSWSIISADGHPLEGVFSFVQEAPITEEVNVDQSTNEAEAQVDELITEESSSNTLLYIVGGVAVMFIIASIALLFTKRKRS